MILNRNFSILLFGQSLANIGDVLYIVSVISTIFMLTGSATASAFVPFTITTSMFISSLFTPLLVGKMNLKWLLTGSQIGKTILLVLLGSMLLDITSSTYVLLFFMIGLIAFLDGCANPISQTLIPHYVKPEHLLQANGITDTVIQLIQAVMWFVGSLVLLILSSQQLIWFVAGLFVISSSLLCLLENVSHQPTESNGTWEKMKEGWKTLSNTPVLRRIALIDVFETIAGTVWIAAIIYVFVSDALHVDERWWGFLNGSFFFGLILGSIFCIKFSTMIEKRVGLFIFLGSLASCIVTVVFSLNNIPLAALLLSFCVGVFGQIKNIPQQTIIQTSVPTVQLATVYTSLGAIGTGMFGIGSVVMGLLADMIGIRAVFILSGLLLAIVSTIVYKSRELFVRNVIEQ